MDKHKIINFAGSSLQRKREKASDLSIPSRITELRQLKQRGEFLVGRILSALNLYCPERTEETATQICVALALMEMCQQVDTQASEPDE